MSNRPPDDWDDLYSERELAEIDELNRMTEEQPPFFERRWARLGIIAASLLILIALLVPTAFLLQGGDPPPPPPATPTPQGQPPGDTFAVPNFELRSAQGPTVRLSDVVAENDSVVLVFYRGYF